MSLVSVSQRRAEDDGFDTQNVAPMNCATSTPFDPIGFFQTPSVGIVHNDSTLSKTVSRDDSLGIARPLYDNRADVGQESKGVNPFALSPIAMFRNSEQESSNDSDDSLDDKSMKKDSASEQPKLSTYFNEMDSPDGDVTEISSDLLAALAHLHADSDDLESLDDGSSTAESEDSSDQLCSTSLTLSPPPRESAIKRLLRHRKSRRAHKTEKLVGISPASYDCPSVETALTFTGTEFSMSDSESRQRKDRKGHSHHGEKGHPVKEVNKHSSNLSVSTMDHSGSHDSDFTTCFGSITEGCSWDANRVELLMPRFDARKETLHHPLSDANLVESILRPWQAAFLDSIGITTRKQLIHARERQEAIIVKAMAKWRRDHNMASFKKSQYALALHIWARACRDDLRDKGQCPTQ